MGDRFPARLARAIGYPDAVAADAARAALLVDGAEVVATEEGGRAILQAAVASGPSDETLLALAGFAAGRILREEAVLAYEPKADAALLWQAAPQGADALALRAFFRAFTASWDWWRARVSELESPKPSFPEVMIRP
jgi:hypothetical protein